MFLQVTTCSREGINKISLSRVDARTFCFGVRIVRRRTVPQVLFLWLSTYHVVEMTIGSHDFLFCKWCIKNVLPTFSLFHVKYHLDSNILCWQFLLKLPLFFILNFLLCFRKKELSLKGKTTNSIHIFSALFTELCSIYSSLSPWHYCWCPGIKLDPKGRWRGVFWGCSCSCPSLSWRWRCYRQCW